MMEWFLLRRLRHAGRWNHSDSWNIIIDQIIAKAYRGGTLSSQRSNEVVGTTFLSFGEFVHSEDEKQEHGPEKT